MSKLPHRAFTAIIIFMITSTLSFPAWSGPPPATKPPTDSDVVGSYYAGAGLDANENLSLSTDNTFTYSERGDAGQASDNWAGTYTLIGTRVTLKPIWRVSRPTPEEASKHTEDVSGAKGEPWTLGDLNVVTWGNRIYLLADYDYQDFCSAINLGREPRNELHGHFFLRLSSDDKLPLASGAPSLPAKWLNFLLPEPVKAKVLKIVRTNRKTPAVGMRSAGTIIQVTLDTGSNNGIKPGMLFYFPGTPAFIKKYLDGHQYVTVASVQPNTCVAEFTAYIDEYAMDVGTAGSTRER